MYVESFCYYHPIQFSLVKSPISPYLTATAHSPLGVMNIHHLPALTLSLTLTLQPSLPPSTPNWEWQQYKQLLQTEINKEHFRKYLQLFLVEFRKEKLYISLHRFQCVVFHCVCVVFFLWAGVVLPLYYAFEWALYIIYAQRLEFGVCSKQMLL